MRQALLVFLAALAAAAILSGCASTPPAPTSPKAAEVPAAETVQPPALALAAPTPPPDPPKPDAILPSARPAVSVEAPKPAPSPAPSGPEQGFPAADVRRTEIIVAGFPQPVPPEPEKPKPPAEPPQVKDGSGELPKTAQPPADAKPKPQAAKPAESANRPQAPAPAAQPAAPKAAPAQAAPPAPVAPKAQVAQPASQAERGKEIAMVGEVGKALKVALPGTGWIYLGDEENAGKIRYQGKDHQGGNTVFSFLAYSAGNYTLKFQQQDLAINSVRQNDVLVKVDSPKTPPAFPAAGSSGGKPLTGGTGQGQNKTVAGEKPRDQAEGPETDEERMERLLKEGKTREALEEIERFIVDKGKNLANQDEWFIRLARLYEADRELKNMKKALWYYEKLRDGFPMSSYWDEADRKSRYIRRNFFDIR